MRNKNFTIAIALFTGVLFNPISTYAVCCDSFAIKEFQADMHYRSLGEYMKDHIVKGIQHQGNAIQKKFTVFGLNVLNSVDSMAAHITQSFAVQNDYRREAEFKVQQEMNEAFGLGLTPCCEVGNGAAAGNRNAWTYMATLTNGLGQQTRFKTGRDSVNFKQGLQKKYGKVDFVEPSGLMYTPEELEAAQNSFGGLADMFPPTNVRLAKDKLTPQAQADYDAVVQTRQWMLEASRLAPVSAWIAYHSALVPSEEWLKAYKVRTGLHGEVTTQKGNLSPRAIQRLKADEAVSIASSSDRLELNEKGLYVELVKLYSEQYAVDVELLMSVKRLPLQLALQDGHTLKKLEEYLSAFKAQR